MLSLHIHSYLALATTEALVDKDHAEENVRAPFTSHPNSNEGEGSGGGWGEGSGSGGGWGEGGGGGEGVGSGSGSGSKWTED